MYKYFTHGTVIELIWTITPAIVLVAIAFPSFRLLYLMDNPYLFQVYIPLLDDYLLSNEFLLSAFVPIMIYHNTDTEKSKIYSENKGKAGIYMWTHIESGKIYIGSSSDLSYRFGTYFKESYLKKSKTIYIYNALLHHGHSSFSLSILEYIDISKLPQEEARKLILSREQFYLNLIFEKDVPNTYNILKKAGSLLGFKYTEVSLAKISGENNHRGFLGKTHTPETKAKMNKSLTGKTRSANTIIKQSVAKGGGAIYVYDDLGTFVESFSSARKAACNFDVSPSTISKYVKNNKLFKNKWYLSYSNNFLINSTKGSSDHEK